MIVFVTGLSAREIVIEDIMKEYTDITIYDATIKEDVERLKDSIYNVSLFSQKELIVLRRLEKAKKIDELVDYIIANDTDAKTIILDYYYEYKTKNPLIKKMEKVNAQIYNIVDQDKMLEEYIQKNLKIKKTDIKKLISIIGKDFNFIKNEIYKYNLFLGKDEFDFKKLEDLISISEDKKISEYVELLLQKKIEFNKIPSSYYISILYSIYREFEILHKLNILDLSYNHGSFKKEYKDYETLFNSNYYPVFLKLKYLSLYDAKSCLEILKTCNENEMKFKSGFIDDKTALYNIVAKIKRV